MSQRYPAVELFAEKLKAAAGDTAINIQLMPYSKMIELVSIALSSGADTIDVMYTNEVTTVNYAKSGWLRPLNDLWDRFKTEFDLDDFDPKVVDNLSVDGNIYAIPLSAMGNFLFYRKDLMEEKGLKAPATIADYVQAAANLKKGPVAGTTLTLRPADYMLNEAHWYLHALADGWFDDKYNPVFNSDKAVAAIELLRDAAKSAQPSYTSASNDEANLALQIGAAAMGPLWPTRAPSMDDPKRSRVVGKIDFAPLPSGHGRIVQDGFSISKFSKQDPEVMFRMLAAALNKSNATEIASLVTPARISLRNDASLKAKFRYYPAAIEALQTATSYPRIPEWYALGDGLSRHLLRAVTGEAPVKDALDQAASETTSFLKDRGYYRG
ncbi:extracellular solute-binding protein [Rhizobium sp. S152]|uniref:extracellular solute-binding protein n=1 Tax=Rhizobium sp. S152 TaxID=3055038 RepID=UPI0025A9A22D|nr:extracellular solute-binding protein [Rhizobium sp. S152]MDM9625263.1 extracellular solute-binding protein [Rhizobium sp. S152]